MSAVEKLKLALPHILCGFKDASKTGKPVLVIASQNKDGSGKMILTIEEPEELLRDIAEVIGVSFEPTKEQELEYKASSFLSKFGLK